jgi:hypothetical protein
VVEGEQLRRGLRLHDHHVLHQEIHPVCHVDVYASIHDRNGNLLRHSETARS